MLPTWSSVPLLHPDVAVVLSYTSLRIQEGKADAPFSTQPRVVAATVLNRFFVELVPKSAKRDRAEIKEDCIFPQTRLGKKGTWGWFKKKNLRTRTTFPEHMKKAGWCMTLLKRIMQKVSSKAKTCRKQTQIFSVGRDTERANGATTLAMTQGQPTCAPWWPHSIVSLSP